MEFQLSLRTLPRTAMKHTLPIWTVYGLLKNGSFVYIGKGRIRDRLLAHNAGDNPCIIRQAPTHFVYSMPPTSQIDQVEKELIDHYDPPATGTSVLCWLRTSVRYMDRCSLKPILLLPHDRGLL
jgi:hypothetical protein